MKKSIHVVLLGATIAFVGMSFVSNAYAGDLGPTVDPNGGKGGTTVPQVGSAIDPNGLCTNKGCPGGRGGSAAPQLGPTVDPNGRCTVFGCPGG